MSKTIFASWLGFSRTHSGKLQPAVSFPLFPKETWGKDGNREAISPQSCTANQNAEQAGRRQTSRVMDVDSCRWATSTRHAGPTWLERGQMADHDVQYGWRVNNTETLTLKCHFVRNFPMSCVCVCVYRCFFHHET